MSSNTEIFIAQTNNKRIGFFTIKRISSNTAEIPLIYFDLDYIGKGLGSHCIHYIENWIRNNWSTVTTLYLDTIVPGYNGGFYRKLGFEEISKTVCIFKDYEVPAIRFSKLLTSNIMQ